MPARRAELLSPGRTGVPSKPGFGLMGWSSGGSVIENPKPRNAGRQKNPCLPDITRQWLSLFCPSNTKNGTNDKCRLFRGLCLLFTNPGLTPLGSIILPLRGFCSWGIKRDAMLVKQCLIFLFKCHLAMMLFLIADIFRHGGGI